MLVKTTDLRLCHPYLSCVASVRAALIALTVLTVLAVPAQAAGTIRFYAIVAAGGSVDAMARIVGEKFGPLVDATVVVENKPGGGGNLATQTVARAAPDGSSLLVSGNNHTSNLSLYKETGYQLEDLIPVAELMRGPAVIVVATQSPYQSFDQLLADAKKRPKEISFGTAGIGTASHFAAEYTFFTAQVKMISVPYRGSGPSLTDLLGGQIPVAVSSLVAAMPLIKAGKLRALAVTSLKRWPGAEGIPTVAEFGMPGFEHLSWIGLFAPKGTPAATIERYSQAVKKVLTDPDVQRRVAGLGGVVGELDATEFKKFVDQDYVTVQQIVKSVGMKPD
jgi:tripartite-type tricarboxylate transporter receptor subunit TctC